MVWARYDRDGTVVGPRTTECRVWRVEDMLTFPDTQYLSIPHFVIDTTDSLGLGVSPCSSGAGWALGSCAMRSQQQ